jgi:hypothetical protein
MSEDPRITMAVECAAALSRFAGGPAVAACVVDEDQISAGIAYGSSEGMDPALILNCVEALMVGAQQQIERDGCACAVCARMHAVINDCLVSMAVLKHGGEFHG